MGGITRNPGVPTTRQVIAGTNMTGGGPLSADVTLNATASGSGALTLIQEVVTASSQANVEFASIPGTYRDLVIIARGCGTNASQLVSVRLRFNNDTGANYDDEVTQSNNNATPISFPLLAGTSSYIGNIKAASGTANFADGLEAVIFNYKNTAFQKCGHRGGGTRTTSAGANMYNETGGFWWRNVAAITEIDVFLSAGNWVDGSVVSLYGRM